MDRVARRMEVFRHRRDAGFDPEHVHVEAALRGRTARKIRNQLRRLEPVALLTPRWTAPQAFLEDLALDLAVGEPSMSARTLSFRPLMGRTTPEAWNFILRVLAELSGLERTRAPLVTRRSGFHVAAAGLLDAVHTHAPLPVALLAHGAHHLPVEVLGDIAEVWSAYADRVGADRRCVVLVAGAVATPALDVGNAARVELADYGEAEAAARVLRAAGGLPFPVLQRVTRFSGGVPTMVEALARGTAALGHVPMPTSELFRLMGPVADEVRAAVAMAMASPASADRLHELSDGLARPAEPEVDDPLILAGVVRRIRGVGAPEVELRAPALASVL